MTSRWQENYQLYKRYLRSLSAMYQKRQDLHLFIELLLSLSVIAIFGVFAIKPTLVTISDLNNQIAGKKETIAQLDAKIEALSAAQSTFDRNRSAIALLNKAVPEKPEPDLFIRQIEGLAKRNQASIVGIDTSDLSLTGSPIFTDEAAPEVPQTEAAVGNSPTGATFDVETNITGTYDQVLAFLKNLENLRRPAMMESTLLRVAQDETLSDILLSITSRLTYLPNE